MRHQIPYYAIPFVIFAIVACCPLDPQFAPWIYAGLVLQGLLLAISLYCWCVYRWTNSPKLLAPIAAAPKSRVRPCDLCERESDTLMEMRLYERWWRPEMRGRHWKSRRVRICKDCRRANARLLRPLSRNCM